MSHLNAARTAIRSAISDPAAAPALLGVATDSLERALASITPMTPEADVRALVLEAESLFAIMGCFEDEAS